MHKTSAETEENSTSEKALLSIKVLEGDKTDNRGLSLILPSTAFQHKAGKKE